MGAAYSNCGRIKVLYAAAFVSLGAKVKLRRGGGGGGGRGVLLGG